MSKIRNFSSYGEKPTIGHYDQDLTNVPVPKSRRDNNYAVDDLGIIHDRISLECIELLDKNDAKGYLMEHATKTACWGTKTARNVTITAINNYNIYKYELKTLIEKRTAKRISRPYKQNKEVNTDFSKLPEAWDVEIKGTNEYLRLKKNSIVPHSHKIEICKACEGIGHNRCTKCQGLMKLNCKNCIKGQVDGKKCGKCKGANEFTCALCKGKGTKPCRYCSGAGKFLWYVIIEATFEPVETEKLI
ncbi:hypothetical protein SNEBB_009461 [Seison nebaliae]|nr:hypothetical protein SNEBB_009461 [Seison nebaliae]